MTSPNRSSVVAPEPALISGSKAVCVRFSHEEHAVLAAEAASHNVTVPELLRLSWHLMQIVDAKQQQRVNQ